LKILIADDERIQRETLSDILREHGHETFICSNVTEAIATLNRESFELILTDFRMPDGNGIELAEQARKICPTTVVMIMTAYADVTSTIEAMRIGVIDYLLKPLNVEQLLKKISVIDEQKSLQLEVRDLRSRVNSIDASHLLGKSKSMDEVRRVISQVALTKGTVLITGESGTGKEVVARSIHAASAEASKRFVAVNCAAIPENLLENEFFGHKKGAYTGAVSDKDGLFKVANGSTIFLDEIGDLPKSLQAKLLRVLQEREITPVGDTKAIKIDVRLIAATNRDLAADIVAGTFRQDLFYRINVVQICMPALKDRPDDVPALAQFFIDKYVKEFSKKYFRVGNDAARCLMKYSWPGNIRELENVIERAIILGVMGDFLEVEHLPQNIWPANDAGMNLQGQEVSEFNLDFVSSAFVKGHIEKVLGHVSQDRKEAAKLLGLGISSLYRKMEELNIARRGGEQGR
jgi:DNA-binding NtrC family response regulator